MLSGLTAPQAGGARPNQRGAERRRLRSAASAHLCPMPLRMRSPGGTLTAMIRCYISPSGASGEGCCLQDCLCCMDLIVSYDSRDPSSMAHYTPALSRCACVVHVQTPISELMMDAKASPQGTVHKAMGSTSALIEELSPKKGGRM